MTRQARCRIGCRAVGANLKTTYHQNRENNTRRESQTTTTNDRQTGQMTHVLPLRAQPAMHTHEMPSLEKLPSAQGTQPERAAFAIVFFANPVHGKHNNEPADAEYWP